MEGMAIKIPADVREAMTEVARRFGRRLVGKTAAKNMVPEERLARAQENRQSGSRSAGIEPNADQGYCVINLTFSFCVINGTYCSPNRFWAE
jgi:hypothetical protein